MKTEFQNEEIYEIEKNGKLFCYICVHSLETKRFHLCVVSRNSFS